METKLERIADKSAHEPKPEFTSLYHLINKELLMQCHRELDGSKAVGIDEVTKKEYGENLEQNIKGLVERLKRKSYKPQPSLRVYIPKSNGKLRPLGIASYEDKIVQLALKKILEAIYEPRFLNCMYGFRPNRGCHGAVKELYERLNFTKICYIVDADIKGFLAVPFKEFNDQLPFEILYIKGNRGNSFCFAQKSQEQFQGIPVTQECIEGITSLQRQIISQKAGDEAGEISRIPVH